MQPVYLGFICDLHGTTLSVQIQSPAQLRRVSTGIKQSIHQCDYTTNNSFPPVNQLIRGMDLNVVEGMEDDISGLVLGIEVETDTLGVVFVLECDDFPAVASPGVSLVGGGKAVPFVAATVVGTDEGLDVVVGGVPDKETVLNVGLSKGERDVRIRIDGDYEQEKGGPT